MSVRLRPWSALSANYRSMPTWSLMLVDEVLVSELFSVDALAASAVVPGEVSALAHEVGDDAVEAAAFVTEALLTGAQSTEIFCRNIQIGYYGTFILYLAKFLKQFTRKTFIFLKGQPPAAKKWVRFFFKERQG